MGEKIGGLEGVPEVDYLLLRGDLEILKRKSVK